MFSILIQKYTSDFSKLGKGLQKYLHHLRKSKYGNLMVGVVFGASELLNATISAGNYSWQHFSKIQKNIE